MKQIELVTGFMQVCGEQKPLLKPSTISIIVEMANRIIAEEERDFNPAKEGQGLQAWLFSDDTGLSSRYMAYILCNGPEAEYAHPIDVDDFGRCYRFLKAVPDVKGHMHRLESKSRQWEALVELWDHLSAIYEQGHNGILSDEIQELLKGVEK